MDSPNIHKKNSNFRGYLVKNPSNPKNLDPLTFLVPCTFFGATKALLSRFLCFVHLSAAAHPPLPRHLPDADLRCFPHLRRGLGIPGRLFQRQRWTVPHLDGPAARATGRGDQEFPVHDEASTAKHRGEGHEAGMGTVRLGDLSGFGSLALKRENDRYSLLK